MSRHDMNLHGQHFAVMSGQDECIGCQQCALMCPEAAIEIQKESE